MFVDYLKLHVKAGDGGNGCVAFRREKFVPRGGPSGGDGGAGGHIIFEADAKLGTLLDLKHRPQLVAKKGRDGGGNQCTGRDGDDIVVRLPLGTIISDEEGNQLTDLSEAGQQWTAARGGDGGKGNLHYANASNKAPRKAQDGFPGQERNLILELKLIGDIGLVGLPNAGKSTLLARLTAATPKIASYPFTTLSPNLGVMQLEDLTTLTLADIPGLIEGASRGAGLGDRFLRHIERTGLLAHLVGDENGVFDAEDMLYKYDLVQQELASYSQTLADKKQLVVLTKIDLVEDPEDLEKTCAAFRQRGIEPFCISSESGEGLEALAEEFRRIVEKSREEMRDDTEQISEQAHASATTNGEEIKP